MQDKGMMKRIIIATIISFVFFVFYDYFVIQPQVKAINTQKVTKTNTTKINNQTQNSKKISKTELKKAKVIATIKSSAFEVHIDEVGRISQYILEKNIFNDKKGHKLELLGNKIPKPLEIRFENKELNKEAFNTPVTIDRSDVVLDNQPKKVTITQKLKELTLQKIITFYPDGHYDLQVKLSKDEPYFLAVGYEPQAAVTMYAFHGAILENPDGTLEKIEDGDAEEKTFNHIKIAAMVDQYYTTFNDAIVMKPLPLKKPNKIPEVNLAICIFCGLCEDVCPTKPEKAIKLSGGDFDMRAGGDHLKYLILTKVANIQLKNILKY
jgi:YidC/Oxa1 family membrane protein insertase